LWFVSVDITQPESAAVLTQAVKDCALGLGEIKYQVQCDGPEMKRMYALAALRRYAAGVPEGMWTHSGPM